MATIFEPGFTPAMCSPLFPEVSIQTFVGHPHSHGKICDLVTYLVHPDTRDVIVCIPGNFGIGDIRSACETFCAQFRLRGASVTYHYNCNHYTLFPHSAPPSVGQCHCTLHHGFRKVSIGENDEHTNIDIFSSPNERKDGPSDSVSEKEHITRPKNKWILYRSSKISELKEKFPKMNARDISVKASRMWKSESDEVKKYFEDLANAEAEEHKRQHPDYLYSNYKRKSSGSRAGSKKPAVQDEESKECRELQAGKTLHYTAPAWSTAPRANNNGDMATSSILHSVPEEHEPCDN